VCCLRYKEAGDQAYMYARDPSLIIISATRIFHYSHSLISFVRRISAIFHHGCQARLKPPKTSCKKEAKGVCMPGFYFSLFGIKARV
jgi:hypothetical protein